MPTDIKLKDITTKSPLSGSDQIYINAVGDVDKKSTIDDIKSYVKDGFSKNDITDFSHIHPTSEITNLDSILSGKASSSHTHISSDITGTAVLTNDSRLSDARTPISHNHNAVDIVVGTLDDLRLSNNVVLTNDSRLSDSRTPLSHTHPKTDINNTGTWEVSEIPDLDTGKITTGQFAMSRLASGTPNGTKFIRDDGVLAVPSGGSSSINTLKKTGTQIINGTAFQDISDLTFSVVNGTNYAFKYYIVFRSAATTTGFRFGVNCPTGTLDYFQTYQTIANSSTVGVATWLQRHDVTRDAMTATTATITAGVDLVCIIDGRYLCTQNGTFAPRVASELANNDIVIQIGSWGMYF